MYDMEYRVQADFDAKTELLKGEISRVRGSLNTDCLSFEERMNESMINNCQEELKMVGSMGTCSICMYACMYMYVYVYMHVCMYACMYMCVCMYVRKYVCMYV
jgi:hypothetical protein